MITVSKKPLFLFLSSLGLLSLQTRIKLGKSHKGILNSCKLRIVFKSQNKLGNAFGFKDCIPKELTSGVVYKCQCGLCNESYYGESVRQLIVKNGKHIRISPLSKKKVKPFSLRVVWLAIICYFVTIHYLFKILIC